ncbi:MAG TPA: hypothetical protein VFN42_14525 [Acetobacteraceae bacterium]|nr:hypothetical protein [Acetobacteraceae bacterium]
MLDDDDYDRLVAQIYAAAADASLLPALLEDLRAGFGGSAAALIAFSEAPGQSRVVATRQEAMAEYRRHWDARNPLHPLRRTGGQLAPGTIATDAMLMPRDALIRTDYFNEFLLAYELPNLLAVKLAAGVGQDVTLNLFRGTRQGGFDPVHLKVARRLGPHLHGATRIASRLAWAGVKAGGSDAALDRLVSGTVLLDRSGRVVHVNAAAERMLAEQDGLQLANRRLTAKSPGEHAALARLIGRAAGEGDACGCGGITVSRPSGRRAWALIAAPLRVEVAWLAPQRPAVVVSITDPEVTPTPAADRLVQLYGLTAREADVALGIARGAELREVADGLGLTQLSARQYLSRALRKTGAHRQHDLTRLLVSLGAAAG